MKTKDTLPETVRRDVLLSMALANCGLAGESLEGKSSQVSPNSYGLVHTFASLNQFHTTHLKHYAGLSETCHISCCVRLSILHVLSALASNPSESCHLVVCNAHMMLRDGLLATSQSHCRMPMAFVHCSKSTRAVATWRRLWWYWTQQGSRRWHLRWLARFARASWVCSSKVPLSR